MKESEDLSDQQERLDTLKDKLDPTCKYKVVTKEGYELMCLYSFPSGSTIGIFALQHSLD